MRRVCLPLILLCFFLAPGYGQLKDEGLAVDNEKLSKKVAVPLSNTLEKVKQLNGYTYDNKYQSGRVGQEIGMIASEVEKVFPQLVYSADDGTKRVHYPGLIPVLIEAIKEQQLLIDQLLVKADEKEFDYQQLKETIKKQSELFKKQKKLLGKLQEQNYQIHTDIEMIKMSMGLEASIEK